MGYVNLPADLQGIFQTLENRVDKLENAQRFTLPNVPVTVTAATGNGTTVTYTARNNFLAGQTVTISGLAVGSGASLNLANVAIASATYSQFTVTNTTVGVSAGSGTAVAVATSITTNVGDPTYPRLGDQWLNMTNNVIGFVDARGGTGNIFSTYATKVLDTDLTLTNNVALNQNIFGPTSSTLTLAPYRTYKIEFFIAVTLNQTTTTVNPIFTGLYTSNGGAYNFGYGQWNSSAGWGNGGSSISPFVNNAANSGAFTGAQAFSCITAGLVQTGTTAVTAYPYVSIGGANINSILCKAGSYMVVTSLGNSAGVQVGPWA